MGAAICVLSVLLLGSMVTSCRHTVETANHPRSKGRANLPPAASPNSIIRVRLAEAVNYVELATTGGYCVLADDRPACGSGQPMPATSLRHNGSQWWLGGTCLAGYKVQVVPEGPNSCIVVNGHTYRGEAVARADESGPQALDLDNFVSLEGYLASVLPGELYRSWHQEAYNALAVCARTYAIYEMTHAGRTRDFDVYDDQRSQVYGGVASETDKSLRAVNLTRGQVLVAGEPGHEAVFKAYYSSCCGGITNPAAGLENQERPLPALAGGVVCPDCTASARYRWPPVRLAKSDVFVALARVYPSIALFGGLRQIRVTAATRWGRPETVEITGPVGQTIPLRADDLRLAISRAGIPGAGGLYSINCTIQDDGPYILFTDGKGYGHGVGLCQYGAQGKALRGLSYYEILYSYYPGAKIISAYQ